MNDKTKNLIIGFVLLNLVIFGVVLYFQRAERSKAVGGEAPGFTLPVVSSNEMVSLEQYRGKVVLLDFWATWCPPCREQMPAVQSLAEDESLSQDVQILSVNTDERGAGRVPKVKAYLDDNGYTFTTVLDDGRASSAYRVSSIPTLVVIQPDGELLHQQTGVHSEKELRELIAEAKEAGRTPAE
jgi:thiol-disulfide isomerase/thioredoxin